MTEARERGGFRLAQALTTRATHARGVRDARDLLSTADAVHAAVARTHVIVVDFARWRAELVGALTEQGATVATVARNERDMRVARAALASAVARRSTFSRTIERLTGAEDAALALPAARETVALAEVKLATTTAYVEQLRVDERMVMMRRHAALREGLRMLCEEQGIRPEETADEVYAIACAVARHAVREDERLLAEATELPARIEAAIMSSAAADEARKQVHAACADLAARAAQFDELQRARDEHHEAEHDVSRCHDDLTAAEFVVTSDPERLAHVEHKILTLRATCAALSDERSCLAPLVANAALLVAASERAAHEETAHATSQIEVTAAEEEVAASRAQEGPAIAAAVADVVTAAASEREHLDAALQANAALDGALATMASAQRAVDAVDPRLEEQFATAEASLMAMSVEVEAAATELAAAKDTGVLVASDGPSVPIAEALCVEASQATEDAAAAVVRAEEAHAQAVAAATRIAEMTMTRAAAEEDLADWNELASDLGRHGLQSDLIDSAAPALTAMANDLLRSAGVTRWTVKFTTESVNSDGEMVPGFPLLVHDALTGETREARTFSGGETVLLDAGVANAVAALACTRAGIHEPVLVRDESGAQLDPENEVAWIAMLRRTAAITRASRVFVVTHAPSLRAMCDSVVWVGKGAITVGDEPPVAA